MKILLNNIDLNKALYNNSNIGFVPTMGGLHKGHISLIRKSKKQCKKTMVSIFVNPTQFNNKKDFQKYPRNLKKDLSILKKLKVNFVYVPNKRDIYSVKSKVKIKLKLKEKILCAKFRKGHFEGVIDVMTRLVKIIHPTKIFMGEKDFQQLHLVKMHIKKKFKSKIISCKTIRDKSKLALSTRNILLSKDDKKKGGHIAKNLISFKILLSKSKNLKKLIDRKKDNLKKKYKIKVEYLELRKIKNLTISNKVKNSKLFFAYYMNKVRLIDNF